MLRKLLSRLFVAPYSATYLPSYGGGSIPILSPMQSLRFTPVYRAVTLISSDIARLDTEISASGADSLWRAPSHAMSAYEFRRSMTLKALIYGNAFAVINRSLGGELLELIPLENDEVTLDVRGIPYYKTSSYGDVPIESMLHIRAPGTSGLWGDSPIRLCSTAMSLMAAQESMALNAYANAGNPKIALVHPNALSLEARQRIMADYAAKHSGTNNTGVPLVLAEGMRIERISSTLDDTGLAAARSFSVSDVSRIYGVPLSYLAESTGSAYGSMEWLSRMYVDSCLSMWLEAWRSEVLLKLATPFDTMYWDVDALIRPGVAEHMAALRTGVEAGIITRNEARDRLDLEPLEGLDEIIVALNMGTGGGKSNIGDDTDKGMSNDFPP